MTAHKHAAIAKAKLDNMELVVFRKTPTNETWEACRHDWMPTDLQDEYFLCLPQHKEACLHWLNGGKVEYAFASGKSNFGALISFSTNWVSRSIWMDNEYELRIKPRKEKRWIAINVKDGDVCMCTENSTPAPGYQIKEIEVEI